jgi:hypothetical protein
MTPQSAVAVALELGIVVGFTGTQSGMTDLQKAELSKQLRNTNVATFHHGDCIGADEEACAIARFLRIPLYCHPPIDPSKRAFVKSDVTFKEKPYLKRNMDIAMACERLYVTPKEQYEQWRGSGTWATYRYGKKHYREVIVIFPDGSLSQE